jgi:nucleoside-diphosphate-sugar epimerase
MLVAVIGGTRHIGPYVVKLLVDAGHQVAVYNRGRTVTNLPVGVERVVIDRSIPGQLTEALRTHRPQAIVDLIAFEARHIKEIFSAELSLRHYVFCSTTAVYGQIGRETPDEATPVSPYDDYSTNKIACEQLLLDECRTNDFPVTILRLAHIYGPGDNLIYTTGRESQFLDRMRNSRPIIIPGTGQTRVHPIYAEDAARAFVYVLGGAEHIGRTYNLAGEQILSLDEYFDSIARVLSVSLITEKLPGSFFRDNADLWKNSKRKFDFGAILIDFETAYDITALAGTGFQFHTDHDTGVARTLKWLDANGLIPQSSDKDEEDIILRHNSKK